MILHYFTIISNYNRFQNSSTNVYNITIVKTEFSKDQNLQ